MNAVPNTTRMVAGLWNCEKGVACVAMQVGCVCRMCSYVSWCSLFTTAWTRPVSVAWMFVFLRVLHAVALWQAVVLLYCQLGLRAYQKEEKKNRERERERMGRRQIRVSRMRDVGDREWERWGTKREIWGRKRERLGGKREREMVDREKVREMEDREKVREMGDRESEREMGDKERNTGQRKKETWGKEREMVDREMGGGGGAERKRGGGQREWERWGTEREMGERKSEKDGGTEML